MFSEKILIIFEKIKRYSFLIGVFYLLYVFSAYFNTCDWDLWARLAVGSIFFQTGKVLPHDIFAYTQTKLMWIDHEWGSGVIFYFLTKHFGDAGLLLLKFSILIFIWFFVFKIIQSHINDVDKTSHKDPYRLSYFILFFYSIMPAFTSNVRSQCFTYLFFAIWLFLLEEVRSGNNKKYIYFVFILIMLIWANVHGGFIAGLGITLAYGLGEFLSKKKWKEYLLILCSSTFITVINPYGIAYWTFLFSAVSMKRPYIKEWWPFNPFGPINELIGFKIFLVLTAISIIYIFIKRRKNIRWGELFILAFTAFMAFKHVRHSIFFIIASASYIYYYLYPALDLLSFSIIERFYNLFNIKIRTVGKWLRDIFLYSLIILIGLFSYILFPLKLKVNMARFPANSVKFIQINHLSGNLLVLFNWGSYALWKLYPQCLIAVDGRYEEVYPPETIDDVAKFHYQLNGWKGLLEKYHTDFMLIPLEYGKLMDSLLKLKDWKLIYVDEQAAIFAPKSFYKKLIRPSQKFDPDKEKYNSKINTCFSKK
ncbi:MAG: hypothetical protein WC197_08270 [Candidatus Gastranaerophilaceae bacterium]|jgi:hypothetical protein